MLAPDLRETLVMVAEAMRDAQDPWWVISSAAVALRGVGPVEVGDVDVVVSAWSTCLTVRNWPRFSGCSDVPRIWSGFGF
ncbi:hypothetical protein [Sphingomonas faeni]|uniref:hypothetical protein n=1 Tax=Sphingomonas faeni TaxID=185950 RepID=UPI0020C7D5E6|nr:hypothetical protein [Sphingomonas faeni]MCP8890022.1 hypothetical protein [Sphingomonas faeni]